MTGAMVWRLCYHVLPGIPATPGPFVIVGMMALFGGVAHAPLAVMIMVAEMTGNLSLLAPAMIAVSLSTLIIGKTTIYTSQLETRADSPAHRFQFSFPLLSLLTVRQAMTPIVVDLRETQTLAEAMKILITHKLRGAPVLTEQKALQGVLTQTDIEHVPEAKRATLLIKEVMTRDMLAVHADETLDGALEELTTNHVSWAPIVEGETLSQEYHVIGILSMADIMRLYRETQAKDSHQMQELMEKSTLPT